MIIGIDLGTTNSLAAYWKDGETNLIPNALGDFMTPSCVGFSDNGEVLVGRAARDRLTTHPELTTAAFKRFMGTNKQIKVGKKVFRPEELSAMVLKSLKEDAEKHLGEPVTEAVITVPAYFSDAQRKATRAAGELAGLKVERLINEPTAASLAYGLHENMDENQFLVFDLGGGTFDVSVLEIFDGVIEVHATAGDNFLGGEDFDDVLEKAFYDYVHSAHSKLAPKIQKEEGAKIRTLVESLKRQLTDKEQGELHFDYKGTAITWSLSRDEFNELAKPLLDRLRAPIERALRDAKIRAADLDQVVLVGGSTRKPTIHSLVSKMFGRLPARHINPDHVVAMGAAVQAGLKSRDAALDEVVLTDVCPYTLGIATLGGNPNSPDAGKVFSPILERNTVIPASRIEQYYTVSDRQKEIEVAIYQGERRIVDQNIFLGKLSVKVPPKPASEESIGVRFTYDINGVLEVEVTVNSTGQVSQLIIEENPGVLTPKEIEKRLKELEKLKVHPRDAAENIALMTKGERLYELTTGDVRDYVANCLNQFQAIMEKQNPEEIEKARKELSEILEEIESDRYL